MITKQCVKQKDSIWPCVARFDVMCVIRAHTQLNRICLLITIILYQKGFVAMCVHAMF